MYKGTRAVSGVLTNAHGYSMRVPKDSYTVVDQHGYPIRTHDGFAVFATERQANWCAELMAGARREGEVSVKENLRELLGIEESLEGRLLERT